MPAPFPASLRMLESVSDSLLNLIFPQYCYTCDGVVESRRLGGSCADCWAAAELFTGHETLCIKCGAFLSDKPTHGAPECGLCADHSYDLARAVGPYKGPIRDAVIRLKSTPVLPGHVCGKILSAFERCQFSSPSIIIPVPLSNKRRIERGFNQADLIGQLLASNTGIAFDGASLVRTAHSPMHRIAMDRKAREITVHKAFSVVRPRLVKDAAIVLVDDVFTSGSTASSCAKVLKKNGASRVYVFTLARAV